MVLAGANSALPHGIPGANKMKRGDFVLFDLGVIIDGYCSDITRTVAFGEISEELRVGTRLSGSGEEFPAGLRACLPALHGLRCKRPRFSLCTWIAECHNTEKVTLPK